jgi:hypothetical protein
MQDLQDLHGHALEAHAEMYPTWFLCNNQLAKHALIVDMMMTMILVQDPTMTARMTVVVMIVELRLAVIQGLLHTALDLHQGFIIPLSQVLVRLEWSRFFQFPTQLNNQVTIQVNIQANIQVIIPVIFAALIHLLLLLAVLLELEPLTNVHIRLVMNLQAATNHGGARRQLLLLGIPLLIRATDGHMIHPVVIVLSVAVVIAL